MEFLHHLISLMASRPAATVYVGLNVMASSRGIAKENVKSALGAEMRHVYKVALLQQGAALHVPWFR